MKKIITLIFSLFMTISLFASSSDEYTIMKENKDYVAVMRIIVKNDKIVSVSFDRKSLDQRSWSLDTAINENYKKQYGTTYREMKTKLIRSAQSTENALPLIEDKELYNEFKSMLEYLLDKIVNKQQGSYILESVK